MNMKGEPFERRNSSPTYVLYKPLTKAEKFPQTHKEGHIKTTKARIHIGPSFSYHLFIFRVDIAQRKTRCPIHV